MHIACVLFSFDNHNKIYYLSKELGIIFMECLVGKYTVFSFLSNELSSLVGETVIFNIRAIQLSIHSFFMEFTLLYVFISNLLKVLQA